MIPEKTTLTNELRLYDYEGRKASFTFGDTNINDGYSFLKVNYIATDEMLTYYQNKPTLNFVARDRMLFNGKKIWHEDNDGPSSGLNADMIDGQHASEFKDRYGHNHFAHAFRPTGFEKQFVKIASFTPRRVGTGLDFNADGSAPFQGRFAENILKRMNAEGNFKAFMDDTPQKLGPVGFHPYEHTDMYSDGIYNATLRASISILRESDKQNTSNPQLMIPYTATSSVDVHIGLFESPDNKSTSIDNLHKYFYISLHDNTLPYLTEQDNANHRYYNGSFIMTIPVMRSINLNDMLRTIPSIGNIIETRNADNINNIGKYNHLNKYYIGGNGHYAYNYSRKYSLEASSSQIFYYRSTNRGKFNLPYELADYDGVIMHPNLRLLTIDDMIRDLNDPLIRMVASDIDIKAGVDNVRELCRNGDCNCDETNFGGNGHHENDNFGGYIELEELICVFRYKLGAGPEFGHLHKLPIYNKIQFVPMMLVDAMTNIDPYHICQRVMDTSNYVKPPTPAKDYPKREFEDMVLPGVGYQKEIDVFRLYHMNSHVDTIDGLPITTHHFDLYMAVEPRKTEFRVQPYMSSSCLLYNYEEPIRASSLPNRPYISPKSVYDERYSHISHRHENYEKEIENIHVELHEAWDMFKNYVQIDQGVINKDKFVVTNNQGHIVCMDDNMERHKDQRRVGLRVLVTDKDKCISESGISITEINQLNGISGNIELRFKQLKDVANHTLDKLTTLYRGVHDISESVYNNANHISIIYGEIDFLERQICSLYDYVVQLYDNVNHLWVHVDALWDHIGKIYAEIVDLKERVRILEEKVAELERRVDELEKRVDKLEDRMDALEKRVDKLEDRVDTLEKRVDKLEDRVTYVEQVLDSLSRMVCSIWDDIKELYDRDRATWPHLNSLWDHVAHIYDALNGMQLELHDGFLKRQGDTMWGDLVVLPVKCNFVDSSNPEGHGIHVINGKGSNMGDYEHARLYVRKQTRGDNEGIYHIGMCENHEFTNQSDFRWPIWTYENDYGRNEKGEARAKFFHLHKESFLMKLAKISVRGDVPAELTPTHGDIWIKNARSSNDLVDQCAQKGLEIGGSGADQVG